jgi:tetratricopeptide (TPR) repeat protein
MSTTQDQLSHKVREFVAQVEAMFNDAFFDASPAEQESVVIKTLLLLIKEFKTYEYSFNLSIEKYVEYFSDETSNILPIILEKYLPKKITSHWTSSDQTDIAFAAYYALSLIYKKTMDNDALKRLCEKPYTGFRAHYPLTDEVLARYYKRNGDYSRALQSDLLAITKLADKGIVNHGPCISYASTICRMYDEGIIVDPDQFDKANAYIQAAIEYNPSYPKYYYLKGKIIYYGAQHLIHSDALVSKYDEAIIYLTKALLLLDDQLGNYSEQTRGEYLALMSTVTKSRDSVRAKMRAFQEISDEELQEKRKLILNSEKASNCPPPNPNLRPGQKYFFVSYNHEDFGPVYCDLLELYRRKFHFQYDKGLAYGEPWDENVRALIQSEDCLGVLFYISQNTLSSSAVEKECYLLKQKGTSPRYLTVNLEEMIPTDILIHYIKNRNLEVCQKNFHDNNRIVNFLTMFNDRLRYMSKPNNSNYLDDLVRELPKQFTDLIIGE